MPDATAQHAPPRKAATVIFSHDGNATAADSISLETIARRLSGQPAQGIGLGSRVWRFAPLALAQERPERPDDIFYALKWTRIDDPVRAASLPRELEWLKRLGGGYFPVAVAHGLLRPDTYLLVSEWIEGRNLAMHGPAIVGELKASGTFERFCGDLVRILERLEAAGIAHSDIWEPNIIVREQRPVLVDFGWARPLGEPPARDNLHQSDDKTAMHQMMLRLGAMRRMVAASNAT